MKKIWLLIIPVMFFAACKDDETPEVKKDDPITNTELITNAHWKMEDGKITPSVEVEVFGTKVVINNYWDLVAAVKAGEVKACDKDNFMVLHKDSTVILDEGPSKCEANDPDTKDGGTWKFESNETKIIFSSFPFDPTELPRTLDIIELTKSKLALKMTYEFENPITKVVTDHIIELDYINVK